MSKILARKNQKTEPITTEKLQELEKEKDQMKTR